MKMEWTQKDINTLGMLETGRYGYWEKANNHFKKKSLNKSNNKSSTFQWNHDDTGETHDDNLNRRGKRGQKNI